MNILSIEILANDLDETKEFYSGCLGLKCKEENKHSLTFCVGHSELVFKRTDIKSPVYHFAFNIPCNKIKEAGGWLAERVNIIGFEKNDGIVHFTDWNAKSVYFFDNNNNILEFIARFDLSNDSNKKFSSENLICISECGIATDDVDELANCITFKTELPVFSKQPGSSNFTALGDDNGLFILSDTKRDWFPAKKSAEKFFTKVKIESDNKIHELIFNNENK